MSAFKDSCTQDLYICSSENALFYCIYIFQHFLLLYISCSLFSLNSAGLVVGLTFGLIFFLLLFIGSPICVWVILCCYKMNRSQRPLQTRVVATTPATGATVVNPNQTTSTANPSFFTQPQYPQQPVYKDAQLSSQEPPPSYDTVTAAANPTQQIPLVICSLLIYRLHNLQAERAHLVVQLSRDLGDFHMYQMMHFGSEYQLCTCIIEPPRPGDCPRANPNIIGLASSACHQCIAFH